MFGGTVRAKDPDRDPKFSDAFLATQMLAMRRMIGEHYRTWASRTRAATRRPGPRGAGCRGDPRPGE